MPRTNAALVIALLEDDYGPKADGTLPDLTPRIATANAMVNQTIIDSTAAGYIIIDTGQNSPAELMERWLSAHYYTKSDPTYTSRAGASFIRSSQDPEPYLGPALDLDPSGSLNALLKRQRASGAWLGKPVASQLTFDQRN